MSDEKLIFVGLNTKNIEMSYIPVDMFSKLMGGGFIRWDGMWIQDARLWSVFFHYFAIMQHKSGDSNEL